jgi:hypothetical protein
MRRTPLSFVVLLASALWWITPARADGGGEGANPTPPVQQQQPAAGGNTPAPVAKKEEETEGGISATNLAKIAAQFRAKSGLADDIATLKAANQKLSSENETLRTRLATVEAANKQMTADWAAIEKGLLEPEDAGDAAATAAAALDKRAASKAAQEFRKMSHDPSKLPGKGEPNAADVDPPSVKAQTAASMHAYWAARKAPWALAQQEAN